MDEREPDGRINRREAIRWMLWGAAGLTFANRIPVFAQAPGPAAPAKAVIQIWMWGGPPHTDTFDPKPNAGYDYAEATGRVSLGVLPAIAFEIVRR